MTSAAAATETAAGGDAPRVIYTAAYGVIGPEQR